jgi:hypothetical protein
MNRFPMFIAGMDTQKSGQILPKHSVLRVEGRKIKNTASHIVQTHTDSYSTGSFPGVKRPEREAGQKLYFLRC